MKPPSELEYLRQENARLRAGIKALVSYLERTAAAERSTGTASINTGASMAAISGANLRIFLALKLAALLR